jgi:N-acetylneuraminic acid mutarotase
MPKVFYRSCFTILLFALTYLPFSASSQVLKGIVLDLETRKPISGVNVYITRLAKGTTTSLNGQFHFAEPLQLNADDPVSFSHIGYETFRYSYADLRANNFRVLLRPKAQQLQEVVVLANRKLKPQLGYRKVSSLCEGLYAFASVQVDDKIYVAGGSSALKENQALKALELYGVDFMKYLKADFSIPSYSHQLQVYSTKSNTWNVLSSKLSPRAYHSMHYHNGKLYMLGGKRLSTSRRLEYLDEHVEVYDLASDSLLVDRTNPHRAVNFATFVYSGNLIVMGGSTHLDAKGEKVCSSKAYMLNLSDGFWYQLPGMPTAKETKGVVVDNTIYLIGGFSHKPLATIESYNIQTGEWTVEGSLITEVERPGLALHGDVIYIYEGKTVQLFNLKTRAIREYAIDLGLTYCELFWAGNTLLVIGGYEEDTGSTIPSDGVFAIDLEEFASTQIIGEKVL